MSTKPHNPMSTTLDQFSGSDNEIDRLAMVADVPLNSISDSEGSDSSDDEWRLIYKSFIP